MLNVHYTEFSAALYTISVLIECLWSRLPSGIQKCLHERGGSFLVHSSFTSVETFTLALSVSEVFPSPSLHALENAILPYRVLSWHNCCIVPTPAKWKVVMKRIIQKPLAHAAVRCVNNRCVQSHKIITVLCPLLRKSRGPWGMATPPYIASAVRKWKFNI